MSSFRAQNSKLYLMGVRDNVTRGTLADANEKRDGRIHADFVQALIHVARRRYADDAFGVDLDETVTALDATTVDPCLTLFPGPRRPRRLHPRHCGGRLSEAECGRKTRAKSWRWKH